MRWDMKSGLLQKTSDKSNDKGNEPPKPIFRGDCRVSIVGIPNQVR
jgi:hypothetical protein